MTLCIGAFAETSTKIVLCSDKKLSADEFSSETGHKIDRLNHQFVSLFADSPARAKELVWMYRDFLRTATLDKYNVVDQLREPIRRFKYRMTNAYTGRRLGLSYDEVITEARTSGATYWQAYIDKVESHPLRVALIIAGFINDFPVLCELRDGELEWRPNFCLIGTGVHVAEPAMHSRGHLDTLPLSQALYNVFEAKKLAETSPFVGPQTTMLVLSPGHGSQMNVQVVTPEGLNYLDQLFKEYGPKPMIEIPIFPSNGLQSA